MYTESAFRLGPSATFLPDKSCCPQKVTRSLSQRVSLPRGRHERVFDGKTSATLEYQSTRKSTVENDLVGHLKYTPANFDTSALNQLAQSEATKRNSVTDALSLQNDERKKSLENLAGLRQGTVIGDGKVYRQTFVIRSYEVGSDGKTSMDTIVSLFQEVAINHFSLVGIGGEGFGATPKMGMYRLIWVITRLHVEVERYPTWPEAVYVDSWTDNAGKNGMMIEWLLRVHSTGETIARGTSTWAMMNQDTRRLSKLPDDVRGEIQPTFVTDKRRAIADHTSHERIPKLDNTAKNITSNLTPAKSDLDGNNHVSNITYIRWIMESMPKMTFDSHELSSITLEYRRECKEGDFAESLTDQERSDPITNSPGSPTSENPSETSDRTTSENGHAMYSNGRGPSNVKENDMSCCSGDQHFVHLLRMQEKGEEVVRARTVWHQGKRSLEHELCGTNDRRSNSDDRTVQITRLI